MIVDEEIEARIRDLETELAWAHMRLQLVPASRTRMMSRTILASQERDVYKEICKVFAPDELKVAEQRLDEMACALGVGYVREKA